jgi:pimeloyl-ACP methyl ester carboxylesterase
MVNLSPEGLLAALGVPTEVQEQLPPEDVAELHAFLDSIVPMGARKSGQLLEQHMSEYDAEQVKSIQAPTLVLHARDDTLVFFDQGEFTAENVPEAELIAMEKGGHLALMMDMNTGAMEAVRDFLRTHNPQP